MNPIAPEECRKPAKDPDSAVLWSNGVRSSARDAAIETRETAPSIPSPPSASPLAQAFAAVAESAFDPDWANDYRATLAAVEQASKTPGDIPDSLIQRLVFESKKWNFNPFSTDLS